MGFLHPERLLWALLIVPLAVIHFWPSIRRAQMTATLPLWQTAIARRSSWEKWKRVVSLAILSLLVLFIVGAMAEPYFTPPGGGRRLAIIIDTSASMNVVADDQRRVDVAVARAQEHVARMGLHDTAFVLASANTVASICGATSDRQTLHAELAKIKATDQPGNLAAAVTAARNALGEAPGGEIFVFTDPQGAASKETFSGGDFGNVEIIAPGKELPNVAVTKLSARNTPDAEETTELFIEVGNYGESTDPIKLTIQFNEQPPVTRTLTISPGQTATHIEPLPIPKAGLCTVTIDAPDAMPADNVAAILLTPSVTPSIEVLASAPPFLGRAAQALPHATVQVVDEFTTEPRFRIIFGETPSEIPPGPALVVAPSGDTDLWTAVEPARGQFQASWTAATPLSRSADLADFVIEELTRVEFLSPAETLAAAGEAPVVSRVTRLSGDVIVLHIDPEGSDLELRPELPLLVANAVQMLSTPEADSLRSLTTTDSILLQQGAVSTLTSPVGAATDIAADSPSGITLAEAGGWMLQTPSESRVLFANLLHANESNLQAPAFTPALEKSPSPDHSRKRPLWIVLAALALLTAGVEWFLFHRWSPGVGRQ